MKSVLTLLVVLVTATVSFGAERVSYVEKQEQECYFDEGGTKRCRMVMKSYVSVVSDDAPMVTASVTIPVTKNCSTCSSQTVSQSSSTSVTASSTTDYSSTGYGVLGVGVLRGGIVSRIREWRETRPRLFENLGASLVLRVRR